MKHPEIFFANLPPYSPEYNPVEQLWKWLKRKISQFRTVYNCLSEKISAIRKITWAYRKKRLVGDLNIGVGLWKSLL